MIEQSTSDANQEEMINESDSTLSETNEDENLSDNESNASTPDPDFFNDPSIQGDYNVPEPDPNSEQPPKFIDSSYCLDTPLEAIEMLQGYYRPEPFSIGVASRDVPEACCAMDVITDVLCNATIPEKTLTPIPLDVSK